MTKNILIGLVLMFLGALITYFTLDKINSWGTASTHQEAELIVEKIEQVSKLITVEAQMAEVYKHKEFIQFDISPFRKQALVRVKAKVSMGVDLTKMKVEVRETDKMIILSDIPNAEILSIDHDLDYYDITQGTFNPFTTSDYNKIQRNAKDLIRTQVGESDLLKQAELEGAEMLQMIKFLVEGLGWEIRYKENARLKSLDQPFQN